MKPRNPKEGDLVLKVLKDETFDPRGKMKPRWSGPFIIKKIMYGGATRITDLDGEEMFRLIDSRDTTSKQKRRKKLARLKTRMGGLSKS